MSQEMQINALNQEIQPDEITCKLLRKLKIPFDIKIGLGEKRKNVTLLSYSIPDRRIVLNGLKEVKLPEINQIEITGKNAVRFFKEVVPYLPESSSLQLFKGKNIVIYPFGERGFFKAKLVRDYPYFFILHKTITKKSGRTRKTFHSFIIKYKLFISAFSLFNPYPEKFIKETEELYDQVVAGEWRKEAKEIGKLLKEIMGKEKEKLITFALKDGREITGVFNRNKSWNIKFIYRLFAPHDPEYKESISVYKHAIDDLWET